MLWGIKCTGKKHYKPHKLIVITKQNANKYLEYKNIDLNNGLIEFENI